MFPGPDQIPVTIDCLAVTGVDAHLPLIFGLAIVILGIAFFVLSRGRLRKNGAALGLVLLLAVGGAGLAISAPASSASADDCTPRDYAIEAGLTAQPIPTSGDTAEIVFRVINVVDRDGVTPIVVRIPKVTGPLTLSAGSLTSGGPEWSIDTSNATHFVFTYTGALPKGTMSSLAEFQFTVTGATAGTLVPITIDTGSGGDTNTTNNSTTVELVVTAEPVPN